VIIENGRKTIERITEVIEKKPIHLMSIVGVLWGVVKYYLN